MQALLPPGAPVIDRLRLTVTLASATDPLRDDRRAAAVANVGRRLIGALVDALPMRGAQRARQRTAPIAERLLPRLTSRRLTPELRAMLPMTMCALADHELATATVAVRVAASGRADPYSAVLAGLGALAGPLHGGASAMAYDFLGAIAGDISAAAAVGERLRDGGLIPGFGHAVCRVDPRAQLLLQRLLPALPDAHATRVEEVIALMRDGVGVAPNVDVALAALALATGMGRDGGEAIFAIARVAGWLAHVMEEYDEPALRFRPTSR